MANQPKKYKKFVATAATATLVASAIVPVASAASLSDIKGNTHEGAINALVDAGVISGYPDGTFKPNKELTRSDVVKLLGKYLVSQGHSIPADAASNPRFADLSSKTNKELLEYAAVVADAGVFAGSNGKLLAGDAITRENMAIVLVRMVNTLNDVSLEEYVATQDFTREVKDINTAKAEARTAIDVLDFYDITSVANFLPKNTVTRGQFATFLNNVIKADFSGAAATTGTVKAINATTVEVTFGEEVSDIKALDFKIEGLEVKNAVVKQTDKKTVVLTTATQTAGKEYTVTVNGDTVGKFVGASSVIPTAIKVVTPSVQGTLGKEVTVSAQVTVPEGQSKAGIPVTFNIVNSTNNQLNEKIEVVAYTNEEGIASYSYTRYYAHNDSVTAYATDKSSVFAKGTVYWAESLTLTEVTEGATLTNGAKKVYKVKASSAYANGFINIAFAENVDVTPDKLVRDVTVTDVGTDSNKYPYQVTTGGTQQVQVKLDKNGEATFTLTGSNATVTPIVFIDGYWDTYNVWKNGNGKLEAQELQAKAPSVKFDLSHTLGLTVEPQGQQNAAAITGKGTGGRNYQVTLTDSKTGKVAPDDAMLKVVFPKGSISKDKAVYITVKDTDGKNVAAQRVVEDQVYTTYVNGSKGQVTFKLTGDKDAYAAPTVFVDNGSDNNKLDKSDLQTASETTYFVDAVVNTSKLTVLDSEDDEVTTVSSAQPAFFEYKSVDQNGFDYYADNGNYEVTYQVSPQFADVYVSGSGLASTLVKKGTTASVKVWASAGKANLRVVSADSAIASNVTVSASSSQISLEDQPATVNFAKYSASEKTGLATAVDTAKDELTIDGVLYSYAGATYKYQGSTITKSSFEGYIGGNTATVSVTKDDEGKLTFNVLTTTAPVTPVINSAKAVSATDLEITFTGAVNAAVGTQFWVDHDDNTATPAVQGTAVTTASTNKLTVTFAAGTFTASDIGAVEYLPSATLADRLTIDSVRQDGSIVIADGNTTVQIAQVASSVAAGAYNQTVAGALPSPEVIKLTVPSAVGATAGYLNVTVNTNLTGTALNSVEVVVPASATAAQVATAIANKLNETSATNKFVATASGDDVLLTAKAPSATETLTLTVADGTATLTHAAAGTSTASTVDTAATTTTANQTGTVTVTTGAGSTANLRPVTVAINQASTEIGNFSTTLSVAVATNDTAAQVAGKIANALTTDTGVKNRFNVTVSGAVITLENKAAGTVTTTTITVTP